MAEGRWFWGVLLCATCVACNGQSEGEEDDDSRSGGGSTSGGTSGGGSANGGTASGGTAGGGTSNGGSSSGTGGSSSGTGGTGAVDCSGAFGTTSRTVLEIPDMSFSGLTLSPDELELIYSAGPRLTGTSQGFFSARRASKAVAFSLPQALPELDAACASADLTRSGDLSFDGLALYFTCYSNVDTTATPLRVARRASLDAPFVVDPEPLGSVTGGPTMSRDELELFASLTGFPAIRAVRSGLTEPFGTPEPIAEFEMLSLTTLELAPNGLDIFASRTTTGTSYGLTMATRSGPGGAFGPLELVLPESAMEIFGSPAISNDCRSLYYVYILAMPLTYRVDVITR